MYEEETIRASSLSLRSVDGVVGATDLNPFFSFFNFLEKKWLSGWIFRAHGWKEPKKSCGGQPVEDSSILAALAFFPQASPNPDKNSPSKKTFDS